MRRQFCTEQNRCCQYRRSRCWCKLLTRPISISRVAARNRRWVQQNAPAAQQLLNSSYTGHAILSTRGYPHILLGFYIINLPSHLDHWQQKLLRQGYKSLSLTFYLSLTLQWGWCLTTQAETLFITWFISVYGGGGEAHCHMCTVRAPCYNCGPGPLGDVVRHTGRWSPGLRTAYTPATGDTAAVAHPHPCSTFLTDTAF